MADAGAPRLPSLEGLQAVEAAARLGTFERAADSLAITASAVSKRVAAVEELLGHALFARGGRTLALTPAGREYLAQVAPLLAQLAALPQHRRVAARPARLRVCTPPTFARQVLVPALHGFTQAHPEVELELLLTIPHLELGASDADVEVRFGDAQRSGTALLAERVTPMLAPALLQRLGPLAGPAGLQGWPLLRTPLEPWTPWFRAAGLPWPEPDSGPRFLDLGLTLEAALAGQGVALGRPSLARHWLASGHLVAPLALAAEPAHAYYLLPHAGEGPAARFAAWLVALCESVRQEAAALARA